jgi:hypothetical protein
MPSSKKTNERAELKIRLEELHNQLVKSSHVSAADKDMLGKMVMGVLQLEDVKFEEVLSEEVLSEKLSSEKLSSEKVQQDISETVTETINAPGLRDTLEQKSLEYEAQHPKLAFILRQILDILARMGI